MVRQGRSQETNAKAREFFEKALAVDADNSQALAALALCYANDLWFWPAAEVNYELKVFELADRALALDRDNILAHLAKGMYLVRCNRYSDARRNVDAGLTIDRIAPLSSLIEAP